ncbi:hypothetical protein EV421DRAFT_997716 [Armillaria borealis]|uniref:Uncharacterized protein n=1 Tax=Armillaria borealis TaxID=47425 RepID=A0AA39JAK4_9AGAR|nr:hypothetical protein EV421DRAFT_997716 [Armillaria borealis]
MSKAGRQELAGKETRTEALTYISENSGCYKTILNYGDANMSSYQKCGYVKENEMAKYAPEERVSTPRL